MEPGFAFFFKMGIQHICDLQAYDHMLFLLVLVAPAIFKDWKALVGHVSAFTVGHCITLVLASLRILQINQDLIETLIPVTIAVTALFQLLQRKRTYQCTALSFSIVLFFGLIHGAGFSNFFRSMFFESDGIAIPLLAFNLGVEAGQIVILAVILLCRYILGSMIDIPQRIWTTVLSMIGLVISVWWILEKFIEL